MEVSDESIKSQENAAASGSSSTQARRTPWLAACVLAIAALLLQLPNAVAAVYPKVSLADWADFSSGVFLLFLPFLCGMKLRPWLICCAVLLPLMPLVTLYYWSTEKMPAVWSLLALYETDSSEMARFGVELSTLALTTPLLLWVYWKVVRHSRHIEPGWKFRGCTAAILLAPIPVLVMTGDTAANATLGSFVRQANLYPVNVIMAFQRARTIQSCYADRDAINASIEVKPAPPLSAPNAREIHVLVIGESARFDAFQINGAKRATTPRLAALPDLHSFQQVTAPACMTGLSVPALITPAVATNISEASGMISIAGVYRKAGYRTWWLSSQRKHGLIDLRCSIFSRDADQSRFISGKLTEQATDFRSAHDGELLPLVDAALSSDDKRVFIVLHTMGSHCLYMDRYPRDFETFPVNREACVKTFMHGMIPIPYMNVDTAESRQQLANAYDNTVLYTDWFLSELISRLKAEPDALTTLTYVSDHGETSENAVMMPFSHGVIASSTIHVPMLVWTSPAFKKERPEKDAALRQHVNTPFCSDTTFHTVIDLAGLECELLKPAQSAASMTFNPAPRLLVDLNGRDVIDYDKQVLPEEAKRQGWHPRKSQASR